MNQTLIQSAAAAGTFTIGGDLTVNRIGYGAMRITGPGIWGPPADKEAALATLRRAIMLGVNLIDTADSYGPGNSEHSCSLRESSSENRRTVQEFWCMLQFLAQRGRFSRTNFGH